MFTEKILSSIKNSPDEQEEYIKVSSLLEGTVLDRRKETGSRRLAFGRRGMPDTMSARSDKRMHDTRRIKKDRRKSSTCTD